MKTKTLLALLLTCNSSSASPATPRMACVAAASSLRRAKTRGIQVKAALDQWGAYLLRVDGLGGRVRYEA